MGNWRDLKNAVAQVIKRNGNQEITGQILQNTLNTIISNVGQYATFVDIATPSTNPGTPDGNVFYIASQAGIYANFGGISLDGQDICILQYDGATWTAKSTRVATKASIINTVEITALDFDFNNIAKVITANVQCRFAVMKNGKNVGLLDCYSNEGNHMFTQEFTTHYLSPFTGDNTEHTDDVIHKYVRSYHIGGGVSITPQGKWSDWKLMLSSNSIEDLYDRINSIDPGGGGEKIEKISNEEIDSLFS